MMNIVGNQSTHEAADHYGWKEGSTEKLLLHGVIGTLTETVGGGNALAGAVSGSVNEFALAYMEKTKGRNWMDTHPDTVQAISTALGAVAGSLTGDRTTGPEKGISGFIYAENRNSNLYMLTMGSKAYASEEEIVEYYKECFIKHGWKYDGCRDNIDYSNHSKIENVYLFNKGIYELTLNFHQSDLSDDQVIRQKKPLKYYITVHPKRR